MCNELNKNIYFNFSRYKDSLMMALKKCRNVYETVYLLCSYFSACKVGLINWRNIYVSKQSVRSK
jgi:hypothetical protein